MSPNRTLVPCTRLVRSPKRGGGVRWLSLLDHPTEARYAALVASVAPAIEASLGAEVVANRAALGTPSIGLPLRPWRPAWDAFLRSGQHLALAADAFVAADVRRCYPSIGPDLVGRTLRRLGCARNDVRGVTTTLEALGAAGVPGLPIGPNPSAVLANAVLAGADEALRAAGVRHLRWVDDVWIFAPGRPEAVAALGSLARWLEGQGLSLAPEKTRVLDRPHEIAAAVTGGRVSLATSRYHRRSDAHALPGVHGPHPVAPAEGGVGPDRRTPRAARRIG
ncbi:MAG TPA: RNA-directed DNA polymerase [Actinomycetota bacterium]